MMKRIMVGLLAALLVASCSAEAEPTPSATRMLDESVLRERLEGRAFKWLNVAEAIQFRADSSFGNYDLELPLAVNPAWQGTYTIEGTQVTLAFDGSDACEPGSLWRWDVTNLEGDRLDFAVLEDGCPEAGGDSTGLGFIAFACELALPGEGPVSCE